MPQLAVVPAETIHDPLPFNIQAEQSLLGALMLNHQTFEHVSDFLKAEHFSQRIHGLIYKKISICLENGQLATPITLKDLLHQDEEFQKLGGYRYLIDLTDINYQTLMVKDYGRLIYDLYLRRELIAIGHETIVESQHMDGIKKAVDVMESAEKKLFNLSLPEQQGVTDLSSALLKAINQAEIAFKRNTHVVGVTSGFIDLDKMLGGLHPSDLLIVAGRPSMGKTAFATNIAFNAAHIFHQRSNEGAPVLFFSLEMSAEQLANRILSCEAGISSDKMRKGQLSADDFTKMIDASRRIANVPLHIDDTPALSIAAIRNRARRMKRQHKIGLIVIDYLQLITAGGSSRSESNRVQEISEITRGLKALAKELHVPVIALSQLSRAVEQREDKRPQLSDLRESGSIEQDADVVMFVFREEYYEARKEPPINSPKHNEWMRNLDTVINTAEIIVAKQRHGPIGIVRMHFSSAHTRFGDLASATHSS